MANTKKRFIKLDMKAVNEKLLANGYDDEYENDVIIEALERRSNELYTKRQAEGFKNFHPEAVIDRIDAHTFIIRALA